MQPADVGWFRSLKSQYQAKWQDWYLTEPKAFTKSNNMKSPGYAKVIFETISIQHQNQRIHN